MKKNLLLTSRIKAFESIVSSAECKGEAGEIISIEHGIQTINEQLIKSRENNLSVYVVGNGGSAGVASHVVNDFVNIGKLKAHSFHDISLLTCMANDYGYKNVYSEPLRTMIKSDDILIAISSSGESENILNAADIAKKNGAYVITFSGFKPDNCLREKGDINIYLSSDDYGFVEYGHAFILHNITDRFM